MLVGVQGSLLHTVAVSHPVSNELAHYWADSGPITASLYWSNRMPLCKIELAHYRLPLLAHYGSRYWPVTRPLPQCLLVVTVLHDLHFFTEVASTYSTTPSETFCPRTKLGAKCSK